MRRKHTYPLTHYAERYAVSIATVKRWSAAGRNLDDPQQVQWEVIGQKNEPPNFTTEVVESDPENPNGIAETCATILHDHQDRLAVVTRMIASGNLVEGCNRAQTIEGHVRLMALMAEQLWKSTVLAVTGKSLKQIKAEIAAENAKADAEDEE